MQFLSAIFIIGKLTKIAIDTPLCLAFIYLIKSFLTIYLRKIKIKKEKEKEEEEEEERIEGKGLIVGGMILSLLIGCNNGIAEIENLEKRNQFLGSVVSLGNEFLNVFTSFGDMVGGVLGFNATTKKSEVGDYFKKIQTTIQSTKDKLNEIISNMEKEGNPNAVAVKTKVEELIKDRLSKIIEGAKKVSEVIGGDTGLIADFNSNGVGAAGDPKVVQSIAEGIKTIAEIVLKEKGKADAGDLLNPAEDGAAGSARSLTTNNTDNGALALFANTAITDSNPGAGKAAKDASKAVSAVTGIAILKAISEGESGNAAKLAKHNNTLSGSNPIDAAQATDATIAGAIALRAMVKDGKFANKASAGGSSAAKKQIKDVAISAVTKVLNTLTIAIRKTIDEELKKVKEAMKISANDTPVTSETAASAK